MSDNTVIIPQARHRGRGPFIPPLLLIPLIGYNFLAFLFMGGNPEAWTTPVLTIPMVSRVVWSLTVGDLMLVLGLVCLFFELLKSTHTGRSSVIEHMLSVLVSVIFLVEFLLVGAAASSVFFLLLMMSAIDVVAGFTVSITGAGRDISME